jgi:DNA-binding transcriptional MerR regulator
MSKQTQIALDFGPEEQLPASTGDNGPGNDPTRHYMSAGGVGVRVKSYKQTPAPGGGDLFGDTAAAPEQATPATAPETGAMSGTTVPMTGTPDTNGRSEAASEAAETIGPVEAEPVTKDEPAAIPTAVMQEPPVAEQPLPEQPLSEQKPAAEAEAVKSLAEKPVAVEALAEKSVAKQVVADEAPLPKRQGTRQKSLSPQPPSKRGRKSLKQVSAEADLIQIPEDEVLFSKQYYTMGEVSEMFRVNQSLLRFWESEFDVLQPRKNKKGDRYFRPVDIKNLHLIYHLLRQKKYTIEGAKEFLKKNKKADERFEVIKRLQEIKTFLLEMKAQL